MYFIVNLIFSEKLKEKFDFAIFNFIYGNTKKILEINYFGCTDVKTNR